jgi:hypothetical protein
MKSKILFIIALSVFAFKASAQTEKGQNVVGLIASYEKSSSNDMRTWTTKRDFSARASYGHFFLKNLVVGFTLGYSDGKSEIPNPDLIELIGATNYRYVQGMGLTRTFNHHVSLGPYIRHYVNLSEKFKFYSELTASIGFGKQSNDYYFMGVTPYSGGYRNYNATLNAGAAFYPTKRIGIELGVNVLSYSRSRTDYGVNRDELSKDFSVGLNNFRPMLGVNFHF